MIPALGSRLVDVGLQGGSSSIRGRVSSSSFGVPSRGYIGSGGRPLSARREHSGYHSRTRLIDADQKGQHGNANPVAQVSVGQRTATQRRRSRRLALADSEWPRRWPRRSASRRRNTRGSCQPTAFGTISSRSRHGSPVAGKSSETAVAKTMGRGPQFKAVVRDIVAGVAAVEMGCASAAELEEDLELASGRCASNGKFAATGCPDPNWPIDRRVADRTAVRCAAR